MDRMNGAAKLILLTAAISAIVLTGCSKKPEMEPEAMGSSYRKDLEDYHLQMKDKQPTPSLWSSVGSKGTLFLDYKARQVGDIIIVEITESSSASNSNSTSTSRSGSHNSALTSLLGLPTNLGMGNFLGTGKNFNPELDTSTSSSFEGAGNKSKSDTVSATIAARVIQVLPSGNLVIEGHREILVDQEKQTITVTGIIRQKDINADNTVASTAIADARISYKGKGILTDANKKGWLGSMIGWLWPF